MFFLYSTPYLLWPLENLIPAEDWIRGTGVFASCLTLGASSTAPTGCRERGTRNSSPACGMDGRGFHEEEEWGWILSRALE